MSTESSITSQKKYTYLREVKDGLYTGEQLKDVLNKYTLCFVLDKDKKDLFCEKTFSIGEVKSDDFKVDVNVDKKTVSCRNGFKLLDKSNIYTMFNFSGVMNEYIAECVVPDSARIFVKTVNCCKSLFVDLVNVTKIYLIKNSDMWSDKTFVNRSLSDNINNLCYCEDKKDEELKSDLEDYFKVPIFGLSTKLMDIIVQTNFFPDDDDLSPEEISYLVSKNEQYVKFINFLSPREKKKLLESNTKLKDIYNKLLLDNTVFCEGDDGYDSN